MTDREPADPDLTKLQPLTLNDDCPTCGELVASKVIQLRRAEYERADRLAVRSRELQAERDMLRRELEAMTELHDAKHRDWRRADDIVDKVRWYLSCRESQHDDCSAANMCHAAGECLRLVELENTDI